MNLLFFVALTGLGFEIKKKTILKQLYNDQEPIYIGSLITLQHFDPAETGTIAMRGPIFTVITVQRRNPSSQYLRHHKSATKNWSTLPLMQYHLLSSGEKVAIIMG